MERNDEETSGRSLPPEWRRELSIRGNPDKRIKAMVMIPASEVRRPANVKLTPEMVMYIRYGEWKSLKELSFELGVSTRCIWEVANYYTWRDLP